MKRILIVDDEELIRTGLKKTLARAVGQGILVEEAGDGLAAVEKVRSFKPDIVVTDIRMPLLDGLDMIEKIRGFNMSIPIVIISGFEDFAYAKRAIRYGVKEYLLKPLDEREFIALVRRILNETASPKIDALTGEETSVPEEPMETVEPGEGECRRIIEMAKAFIVEHAADEASLTATAAHVKMSGTYFSYLFKKETGMNFIDFITLVKMEKSAQLIRDYPELRIYEIAERLGYRDVKYFNRVFKKRFSLTPGEYREARQLAIEK